MPITRRLQGGLPGTRSSATSRAASRAFALPRQAWFPQRNKSQRSRFPAFLSINRHGLELKKINGPRREQLPDCRIDFLGSNMFFYHIVISTEFLLPRSRSHDLIV